MKSNFMKFHEISTHPHPPTPPPGAGAEAHPGSQRMSVGTPPSPPTVERMGEISLTKDIHWYGGGGGWGSHKKLEGSHHDLRVRDPLFIVCLSLGVPVWRCAMYVNSDKKVSNSLYSMLC